jgi:hypothetical protein
LLLLLLLLLVMADACLHAVLGKPVAAAALRNPHTRGVSFASMAPIKQ